MTITDDTVSLSEFEALDNALPEGLTAELINGRVIVVPAPDGNHDENVMLVSDQIRDESPELRLFQERGLSIGTYRDGRARADGVVVPRRHFVDKQSWADPSGVLLVLEVTSGTSDAEADVDRVEKRDAYAESGIPVYLLIDRRRRQVTVHWAPTDGQFTHQASVVYGEKLALPEPFNFDLETADLK